MSTPTRSPPPPRDWFWLFLRPTIRWARRLDQQLRDIERKLDVIINMEGRQMAAIDDLEVHVAAQTTVIGSVNTLLGDLKRMLDEAIASGNMARVQAVADQIAAHNQQLADAVVANTPA